MLECPFLLTAGRGDLLSAIQQGKQLQKVGNDQGDRGDFLSSIKKGANLRKVEPSSSGSDNGGSGGGRNDLLSQIRGGASLRKVVMFFHITLVVVKLLTHTLHKIVVDDAEPANKNVLNASETNVSALRAIILFMLKSSTLLLKTEFDEYIKISHG
jgi:hypothetical protein